VDVSACEAELAACYRTLDKIIDTTAGWLETESPLTVVIRLTAAYSERTPMMLALMLAASTVRSASPDIGDLLNYAPGDSDAP
jgi:hypothetical protein